MSLTLKDGFGRDLATIDTEDPSWSLIAEGITKAIDNVTHNLVTAEKKKQGSTQSEEVVTGYVEEEELVQLTEETVDIPANFAGLEAVMVPTRLRDQLFEITEVVEGEEYVEVTAMHIFYRQRQNATTWTPSKTTQYSCAAICRNVMTNVVFDLGFDMATDCTDMLWGHEFDYARKNLAEIFLDPESGICKRFNLSLIRDNTVFYCLKNVGYDRGFVIEDGKNLLGVERTESIEDVVTRICPLGRDASGNLVWMNYDGKNYVDSSRIGNYSSPKLEIWQTDIRIGEDDVTAENIHTKLRNAARKRFSDDHVDRPDVEMTIQFLSLGDTEEYQQYRNLDRVYLYDIIHVKDSRRGYSYEAQVIGIQHNILTGVLESVTIGKPKKWNGVRTVAIWQVPEVDGRKIRQNSIRSGSFVENAIHDADIASGAIDGRHFGGGGSSKVKELCVEQLIVENESEDGLLHTRFAVTEGLIAAEVTRATGAEGTLSGQISVEAGKIQQIVSAVGADGTVTAASIVLAINESTGQSEAQIDADHVYIGNTKSTTVIAGKCALSDVTAAYISSQLLNAGHITVNGMTVAGDLYVRTGQQSQNVTAAIWDLNISLDSSTNTYTLQRKRMQDSAWVDVGTFSRATSLSGAWSGGKLTVTASPQGSTFEADLFTGGHWGYAPGETWTTYYGSVSAKHNGGATSYSTGEDFTVDALDIFESVTVNTRGSAESVYIPASDGTLYYTSGGSASGRNQGSAGPKLALYNSSIQLYYKNSSGGYSPAASGARAWYYDNDNGTQYYTQGSTYAYSLREGDGVKLKTGQRYKGSTATYYRRKTS